MRQILSQLGQRQNIQQSWQVSQSFCTDLKNWSYYRSLISRKFPYEEIIPDGIQTEEDGKEWMVTIYEKIK